MTVNTPPVAASVNPNRASPSNEKVASNPLKATMPTNPTRISRRIAVRSTGPTPAPAVAGTSRWAGSTRPGTSHGHRGGDALGVLKTAGSPARSPAGSAAAGGARPGAVSGRRSDGHEGVDERVAVAMRYGTFGPTSEPRAPMAGPATNPTPKAAPSNPIRRARWWGGA